MPVGRVRTRSGFTALAAGGRRARRGVVRVTALVGPDGAGTADRAEVAFAIGKPVGNAVVRNKVRRRCRAVLAELDPKPGTYLVATTPAAATTPYGALRDDLAAALTEVGAL